MKFLKTCHYPGNIRELKYNWTTYCFIRRSYSISKKLKNILQYTESQQISCDNLREAREEFEKNFIKIKIQENIGNLSKTANMLGIY